MDEKYQQNKDIIKIYVDASNDSWNKSNYSGIGVVVTAGRRAHKKIIYKRSYKIFHNDITYSELLAIRYGIEWAIDNDTNAIVLSDSKRSIGMIYALLEFLDGNRSDLPSVDNELGAIAFDIAMKLRKSELSIRIQKIKAHSGVLWHDVSDQIAKEARR